MSTVSKYLILVFSQKSKYLGYGGGGGYNKRSNGYGGGGGGGRSYGNSYSKSMNDQGGAFQKPSYNNRGNERTTFERFPRTNYENQ
jgi:hypothetical protein